MVQDRRLKRRFPIQAAIVVTGKSRGQVIGTTRDLHSRGLYFYTDASLPPGEHIEFTLTFAADVMPAKELHGTGRVARVEARGAGEVGIAVLINSFRVAE